MPTLGQACFGIAALLAFVGSASADVQAEVEEVRLHAWLENGRAGPLEGGVLVVRIANHTDAAVSIETSPVEVRQGRRMLKSCNVGITSMGRVGERLQVTRGPHLIPAGETWRLRLVFHCRRGGDRIVARNRQYRVNETLSWRGGRARVSARTRPRQGPTFDGI